MEWSTRPAKARADDPDRLFAEKSFEVSETSAAVIASLGLAACDVDQTREAEAPEVDVDASAGQLPRYDVDGPEVNVGTENVVVQVPDVDVSLPEDDEAAAANRQ